MTRVDYVKVGHLAGRRKSVEFELNPDINVFFGLNGRGKTSLLKLIHAGLVNDNRAIQRIPFDSATIRFYSHDHDHHYVRSVRPKGDRSKTGEVYLVESEDGAFYEVDADDREARKQWITSPAKAGPFAHSFLSTSRLIPEFVELDRSRSATARGLDEADLDRVFARHLQRIWQSYTNSILSQVRRLQANGIASILESVFFAPSQPVVMTAPVDVAYNSVISFLRRQGSTSRSATVQRFRKRYEEDIHLQRVVGNIEKLEQGVKALEEPRRRLEELAQEFFGKDKKLLFSDNGIQAQVGEDTIDLASCSSGEKHLLRILVECIRSDGNTIIIDEPELSMHIDWQRLLISTMRQINPESQIIVATHSPEIMSDIDDSKIFEL